MARTSAVPTLGLHEGVEIPQLGFGVFQVPPPETQRAVEEALEAGYRHVDTAAAYRNEEGVGAAIAASGLGAEEVFVTTKLWNSEQGYDTTLRAFERSLARLGLGRLDLYLIHWPVPSAGRFIDSWRAFQRIRDEGLVRAIGVSNFRAEDIDRLEVETGALPSVNQIELHPALQQTELRAFHGERGIATEAWSPLARGQLLADESIGAIADAHGKSPAQAIIRWHLQLGNVVIPKSARPARIRQNFDVFDFELSDSEMASIAALDTGERIGPDPATFLAP